MNSIKGSTVKEEVGLNQNATLMTSSVGNSAILEITFANLNITGRVHTAGFMLDNGATRSYVSSVNQLWLKNKVIYFFSFDGYILSKNTR